MCLVALAIGGCGEPTTETDIGVQPTEDVAPDLADAADTQVDDGPVGSTNCPAGENGLHFSEGARCLPLAPTIPELQCRENWSPTDSGGCAPDRLPSECDAGHFPVLGLGCVEVSRCQSATDEELRERFDTPGTVWRVEPGELAESIVAAAPGDILALSAGDFVGQFDVSELNVVGVCAAETVVRSEEPSTGIGALNATRGHTEIHDLKVSGNAIGVWVSAGGTARLRSVEVEAARRIGVRVAGGGSATLEQVWVHDMLPSFEDDSFGRGIQVSSESFARLEDVTVQRVRDIGVVAIDSEAVVEFENLAVDTVTENEDPRAPGNGVQAFANGASVTGTALAIWDTQSAALVSSGGVVDVEDVYIEGLSVPDTFETDVRGAIRTIGTATLSVERATVTDADGPALQVDAHAEAELLGWRVSGISGPLVLADELAAALIADAIATAPTLLQASNGVEVTFQRSELNSESGEVALSISNASTVSLLQSSVSAAGTVAEVSGSTLNAEDVLLEGSDGVSLSGEGTWRRTALVSREAGLDVLGPFTATDLEITCGSEPALTISRGRGEIGQSYLGGGLRLVDGEYALRDSVVDASDVAVEIIEGELTVERLAVVGSAVATIAPDGVLIDEDGSFDRDEEAQ